MLSAEALAAIGGTNCLGSLTAGWLGGRYPKHILLGLDILRAFALRTAAPRAAARLADAAPWPCLYRNYGI